MEEIIFVSKQQDVLSVEEVKKIFKETDDLTQIKNAVQKANDRLYVTWATVDATDNDKERIPIEDVIKQQDEYMATLPAITDLHKNRLVGKTLDYKVLMHPKTKTLGILYLNQIFKRNDAEDKVWQETVNGEREGTSVGGMRKGHRFVTDENGDIIKELTGFKQWESANCYKPANPYALTEATSLVAKSEDVNKFIREVGNEWCVFSRDGDKIACHPTKEEALAQLRAIEANKMEENTTKQDDPDRICGFIWNDGTDKQRGAFGSGTEGRGRNEKAPEAWWNDCTATISSARKSELNTEKMVDNIGEKRQEAKAETKVSEEVKKQEDEMVTPTENKVADEEARRMIQQIMERLDEIEDKIAGKPAEAEQKQEEPDKEKEEDTTKSDLTLKAMKEEIEVLKSKLIEQETKIVAKAERPSINTQNNNESPAVMVAKGRMTGEEARKKMRGNN